MIPEWKPLPGPLEIQVIDRILYDQLREQYNYIAAISRSYKNSLKMNNLTDREIAKRIENINQQAIDYISKVTEEVTRRLNEED